MNPLYIIALAIFITIIGALPFGLVNLTVLETSYRRGKGAAMHVSHVAALIEVIFGLTALVAGSLIGQFTRNHQFMQTLVLSIPAVAGEYLKEWGFFPGILTALLVSSFFSR